MHKFLLNGLKNNFRIILAEIDPNGIFIMTDGAGLEKLGSSPGYSVGQSVFDIYRDNPELCGYIKRSLKGEKIKATVKVGNSFYDTNYVPVLDKNGSIVKLVIMSVDVTDQNRLEEQLIRNENRLRRAAHISKTANWEYYPDSRHLNYSDELLRIFEPEKSSAEISTESFLDRIHPQDINRVKLVFQESIGGKSPGNVSFRISFPGNRVKYVHADWVVESNDADKVISIFGTALDISDIRIKEKMLFETEQKFKNLYENVMEAAVTVDMNGKIKSFNNSFKEMTGYTEAELYELTYKDLTPSKWHDYEDKILKEQVLVNGFSEVYEKEYIRKDKTVFPIELRTNLIRDDENNPVEMWAFVRNISERKRNEELLRESEARFHGAFNQAPIGMALVSLEGIVLKANRPLCDLFGFDETELTGKTFYDLTHPDDINQDIQFLRKLISGEINSCEFEKRYINKQGDVVWAVLSVSAVRNAEEKPLYLVSQIKDITEIKNTEKVLNKQRAILNASQHIAKVGGWEWDSENEKMYWTDELYALHEYEKSDFNPNSPQHIEKSLLCYAADDRMIILEAFRDCIAKGIPYNIVTEFITAKGKKLFVRTTAQPVLQNGKITGAIGTLMDITAERNSVIEIQKLSSAVEQNPLGILISDPEGKIEYCNSVSTALCSCRKDEIIGRNLVEIFPPDIDADISEVIRTIKRGGQWHGEFQNKNKQGRKYWETVRISPIFNYEGKVINLLLIKEDITVQKENELELAGYRNTLEEMIRARTDELIQSEQKFKTLAENAEDIILRFGIDTSFLYVNKFFIEVTGRAGEEFLGKKVRDLDYPKEFLQKWENVLEEVIMTKQKMRHEWQNPSGRWVDWIFVPELNSFGEAVSVIAWGRDITNIKNYESAVKEALSKEKELTDLQRMFVSTVSHEFRTPLTAIITSVGLLEMSRMNLTEDKKKIHFERINRNINLMTEMLDEVIFLNRSNIHKYEPMIEETDIAGLCTELFNEIKREYLRVKSTVELNFRENLYPTDKNILSKILRNLISNAFKYNIPDGTVYFTAFSLENRIEFIIRDTGLGIPSADQNRIFEPFSRASNSTGIKGTGLGLSIVRRAVEFLKGTVSFDSIENEGTTFKVSIPINYNGEVYVHSDDN